MKSQQISTVFIIIASVGLGLAVLPEVIKVVRHPHNALAFSPYFLVGRAFFFIFLGTGLILMSPKDARVYLIIFLSFWYIAFYMLLFGYYLKEKKKTE